MHNLLQTLKHAHVNKTCAVRTLCSDSRSGLPSNAMDAHDAPRDGEATRSRPGRKRTLTVAEEKTFRKAASVPGASDTAALEIWNLTQPPSKRISHSKAAELVSDDLKPWSDSMTAEAFLRHDGSTLELPLVDLKKCLEHFCAQSKAYRVALEEALQKSGSLTPIIFADEATAGNVLSVDKGRKACLWYLTWLETMHRAQNAHACLTVAVVQSHGLAALKGGASAVMLRLVQRLFTEDNARGFTLPGGAYFKQRTTAYWIGDLEGARAIFSFKGSAGMRPCVLCLNCVKSGSDIPHVDDYFRALCASDGFIPATDKNIFHMCDRLLRCTTKSELENLEKCSGLSMNEHGLLWHPLERQKPPPSLIIGDAMHLYFVNGVASWEIALFVQSVFSQTGITLETLQEAVHSSNWLGGAKSMGRTQNYLWNLFHKRLYADGLFKGQRHQTSAVLPLLLYFTCTVLEPSGQVPISVMASFKALCAVTSFIREIKFGHGNITEESMAHLDQLQRNHHEKFQVYNVDYKPKHHMRLHLPSQLLKAGVYVDCEAVEDKHRIYKSGVAEKQRALVQNYSAFSWSVLPRLLQATVVGLEKNGLPCWELLHPIADANIEDKIQLCSAFLPTSKRHLHRPCIFLNVVCWLFKNIEYIYDMYRMCYRRCHDRTMCWYPVCSLVLKKNFKLYTYIDVCCHCTY